MLKRLRKLTGYIDAGKTRLLSAGYWLHPDQGLSRFTVVLQYGAFFFFLFGIKLLIIHHYGNATPFWDQWSAEADHLYRPFFEHTLKLRDLVTPHNEHRIFTTRIIALSLLEINRIWNPLLQMVVNAGFHIMSIILTVWLLTRVVGKNNLPALLAYSLVLFSIPYSWENTLAGFQSQFYLVSFFSVAAVWLTIKNEPFRVGWWGGLLCSALAFLTLASGIFTLAAISFVYIIFLVTGMRRTGKQLAALILFLGLFIAGIKLTPIIPGHAELRVSSFQQLYASLTMIFGFPVAANLFSSIICNLPILGFIVILFKKRPGIHDRSWFLLGVIIWGVVQGFSIGYGRGFTSMSSRYRELFGMMLLINFGCLLYVAKTFIKRHPRLVIAGAGAWTALILVSLSLYGESNLPAEMDAKRVSNIQEEINMRSYLSTDDTGYLKNKPLLDIPYPDPDNLVRIINSTGIREILPSNINSLKGLGVKIEPSDAFVMNGYYITTPKHSDTTWGSYTVKGNVTKGEMVRQFSTNFKGTRIGIPVAGYPLDSGMKIEVEQNGHRWPVTLPANPKENWETAFTSIDKGPFSLRVTDASDSAWMAVGNPFVVGRLDKLTDNVMSRYYFFILSGVLITLFLLLKTGLIRGMRADGLKNGSLHA
jgi:hypothetical protein